MEKLDLKTLSLAIVQIAEEKGIPQEKVVDVIEMSLAAAYKKEYGKKNEKYRARFDKDNGKAKFYLVKKVVNESMILGEDEELQEEVSEDEIKKVRFIIDRHIMIDEAKKTKKDANPGDEIEFPLASPEKFGRIAAQTAKQVLLQRIREAERESILSEFVKKEGEIVSGIIQRREGDVIFIDIGKTSATLPREEQVQGEFYKIGSRMRFYCLQVEDSGREPKIILSRSHPKFLSKLFEIEVPEISSEIVEIKSVAREAGSRSKIAVASSEEGVDPVGACVGQRGTRVNAVMQELGREKIDIITWEENPEKFVENALSPAKIISVKIEGNKAQVNTPSDQVSLAIGRDGQNVRLASELTGWKIDVKGADADGEKGDEKNIPEEEKVEEKVEEVKTEENAEEKKDSGGKKKKKIEKE